MSEHTTHSPHAAGYESTEPKTRFIAIFGAVALVVLVGVMLGLQMWVDRVREQQVFVKTLEPVSEDLLTLRTREASELHSYKYVDREKGAVRIPIDRAMDLVMKDYAGGANRAAAR